MHLLTWDGEVKVELFDDRPRVEGGTPIALERWDFPSDVVKLLCQKNAYGWGYTLVLPWITSYRPDITQVHLRVCYTPVGGASMYIESDSIKLTADKLVLPQGVSQASAPRPTPAPIPGPATLRLGGQPAAPAGPVPPVPTVAPVQMPTVAPLQAPAPVTKQAAAQPAEAPPDLPAPIVMTLRQMRPTTGQSPAPTVSPEGNRAPANLSFDPLPQVSAQPITQISAQVPADTTGPSTQAGWVGMAK
jgi:hypothetical protein